MNLIEVCHFKTLTCLNLVSSLSSASSHGKINTCNIFVLTNVWDFLHKLHLIHLIEVWDFAQIMDNINVINQLNPCIGVETRRRPVISVL